MGFYQKQPVDPKECRVTYLWTGLRTPGVYMVFVAGDAPNYTTGFDLQRDAHFVGGMKIDSMGWTGPLGPGKRHYHVRGTFPGQFYPQIVISGSNGDFAVKVKEIPHTKVDAFMKKASSETA